jgi:hypothetical protein
LQHRKLLSAGVLHGVATEESLCVRYYCTHHVLIGGGSRSTEMLLSVGVLQGVAAQKKYAYEAMHVPRLDLRWQLLQHRKLFSAGVL